MRILGANIRFSFNNRSIMLAIQEIAKTSQGCVISMCCKLDQVGEVLASLVPRLLPAFWHGEEPGYEAS